MDNYGIKIINKDQEMLASVYGKNEINLVYDKEYKEGDSIVIEVGELPVELWLQLDDALGEELVYVTGNFTYNIPFGDKKSNISPKAFCGDKHFLSIKKAKDFEVNQYRILSRNRYDQHQMETLFPHAKANVETRGESVFAAQNAIDGIIACESHGVWPYQSWGINMQDDATIFIDFGREVVIDRMVIYLRADFPHDNWWKEVTVSFSNEEEFVMELEKTGNGQEKIFETKKVKWIQLSNLKKSAEDSPFPALTQIEIYGEANK